MFARTSASAVVGDCSGARGDGRHRRNNDRQPGFSGRASLWLGAPGLRWPNAHNWVETFYGRVANTEIRELAPLPTRQLRWQDEVHVSHDTSDLSFAEVEAINLDVKNPR